MIVVITIIITNGTTNKSLALYLKDEPIALVRQVLAVDLHQVGDFIEVEKLFALHMKAGLAFLAIVVNRGGELTEKLLLVASGARKSSNSQSRINSHLL